MSGSGTVIIHSKLRPDSQPRERRTPITIDGPEAPGARPARRRRALSRGDLLMRNSAFACALLLGILALGNVNQPWAKKASESVERALTMRINLDDSLGALEFVKNLMPDSALVFMNLSGSDALHKPVAGSVSHPWSHLQPWVMFQCGDDADVHAVSPGTVTAVSPLSGRRYGVLVDHGGGVETLYAQLDEAEVSPGDAVDRGDVIGECDGSLYFEYRRGGESADPTAELGL